MAARASGRRVWWRRGRGSGGPRGVAGQTTAAQASSPRARDDDSTTGTVPSGSFAAQPGEQSLDHAPVDRAQHRVLRGGVAERAVVGHHRGGRPLVLGVGGEPVGGQGVGDGVHGRAQRPLPVARRHLAGQRPPVLLADPLGHALGGQGSEHLEGLLEQQHQQVVASGQQVEGGIVADGPEPLGRPAGAVAGGPLHGHLDVAPGGQALEVVAGHVGMEGEAGGHLGGGRSRIGPDEQVDLPAGRIAEGRGDRRHRRGELAVGLGRVRYRLHGSGSGRRFG